MVNIFNEKSLRDEIISTWGEDSKQLQVFDKMVQEISDVEGDLEDPNDVDMDFAPYIRRPFSVEALEITRENIHELSELIGEFHEDESGPYILADPDKVPTVQRVIPGYWVTKMNRNIRCYAPRVFNEQFTPMTPVMKAFMDEFKRDGVGG